MDSPSALVAAALDHLRLAREHLVAARAPRAAERTRLAISSAKGALRHAKHRASAHPVPTPLFDGLEDSRDKQ